MRSTIATTSPRSTRTAQSAAAGLLAACLGLSAGLVAAGSALAVPAVATVQTALAGETTDHNLGVEGQCTWGAYEHFHQATGVWPVFSGNAADWNDTAPAHGWNVVLDAVPNSVVVFEPGIAGADGTYGHVAWVTAVQDTAQGRMVTFVEMNGAGGPGVYTTRTVVDVPGMSYIPAT